jgi:hypothetical protein
VGSVKTLNLPGRPCGRTGGIDALVPTTDLEPEPLAHQDEHHHIYAPSPSVLGTAVVVVCGGELVALAVNTLLDEDLLPLPSQIIQRISWARTVSRGSRLAARASMWSALTAIAVALRMRAGRRSGRNPYLPR